MRNERGLSLLELLTTIVIISVFLALGTLDFNAWQKKYAIEGQVKEMMVDLTDARLLAIQQKKRHTVVLNPTSYIFRRYSSEGDAVGTQVFSKTLKYQIQQFSSGTLTAFNNTTIAIDERGYTTNTMTIAVGFGLATPALDCLTVHTARINMGKINGTSCVFQ
jgi:prepilin-type N-terminal cleavage/methylation domain-containing protein